jgi:hypothetical protein
MRRVCEERWRRIPESHARTACTPNCDNQSVARVDWRAPALRRCTVAVPPNSAPFREQCTFAANPRLQCDVGKRSRSVVWRRVRLQVWRCGRHRHSLTGACEGWRWSCGVGTRCRYRCELGPKILIWKSGQIWNKIKRCVLNNCQINNAIIWNEHF